MPSKGRLANPEGDDEDVDGQYRHGGGEGGQECPVGRVALSDALHSNDLQQSKGKNIERREENGARQTEQRHSGEAEIGEKNEDVMQVDGALPARAGEQGATLVFDVVLEGGEVEHEEIGNREEQNGRDGGAKQTMDVARLECERKGGDESGDLCREDLFAKTAIDEAQRRQGVDEGNNEDDGGKSESRRGDILLQEENGDDGSYAEGCNGKLKSCRSQPVALRDGLVRDEEFVMRTEVDCQQIHRHDNENDPTKAKPESERTVGTSEVAGDADTEGIAHPCKNEDQGAGEGEEVF